MAELILPSNRHLYEHVLDEMYERRFQLFFDGLGWCPEECGVLHKGYDKDAFDMDHTIYIVERQARTGNVVGFCRLNPSTRSHMMPEVFPHYCDWVPEVPTGPNIWEVSRLGYDYRPLGRDRAEWKEVRARITTSITEYCLQQGIEQVTFCVHQDIFNAIQRDTWGAVPLGNPYHDEKLGETYQAGLSDITAAGLSRCRSMLRRPEDEVLFVYGPMSALQIREAA